MTKRWIKNGVFASNTIELNGCVVCNPTEDMLRQAGYEEYVEPVPTESEKLELAKVNKIAEIAAYDASTAVNGFKLNGNAFWLDKATRVGLMNSTEITKAAGQETTDLWMGEVKLTIPCDTVIKLLSAIEMYALECFNTTARHKAEVAELKTVEEVEKYDIKEGYPKQLEINLQQ